MPFTLNPSAGDFKPVACKSCLYTESCVTHGGQKAIMARAMAGAGEEGTVITKPRVANEGFAAMINRVSSWATQDSRASTDFTVTATPFSTAATTANVTPIMTPAVTATATSVLGLSADDLEHVRRMKWPLGAFTDEGALRVRERAMFCWKLKREQDRMDEEVKKREEKEMGEEKEEEEEEKKKGKGK